jgi:phosphoenolpyruvate carboxylase
MPTCQWFPYLRDGIDKFQMVMIGYSDSAKDAGALAAGWAQYTAQEQLIELGQQCGIRMRLFHGRGGSIGRGGAPAHAALLSQPPGSLRHGLRVTEQGEMIRTKLGLPALALNTLSLYSAAILEANLSSPPAPTPGWREAMDELAETSCNAYRKVIRDQSDFVKYFRQATPELELGQLPLGSRPARRRLDGGIESLRAIPWIFAWTQNRLMLPAWLGAGAALHHYAERHGTETLEDMTRHWPFFATRLSMLCMVYAKADTNIAAHYDEELVEPALQSLGSSLREQLARDTQTVLSLLGHKELLADDPWGLESINLRDVYTAPLNILQATLLKRARLGESSSIADAIMVSIAGIAAGMRNTG